MIFCFYRLLRVFYAAEFTDDVNFNLPRIFEFGFDFLSDVLRKKQRLRVVDLIGLDDNADFAPRLNGVALFYAGERRSDDVVRAVSLLAPGLAPEIASAA